MSFSEDNLHKKVEALLGDNSGLHIIITMQTCLRIQT